MGATAVVTTLERTDLVPIVARWLWEAFWQRRGASLAAVHDLVAASRARLGPPQCFVRLDAGVPVGTASLVARDLDAWPDLTPWLAGVYVVPEARGRGHVRALIGAAEAAGRAAGVPELWLHTRTAERLYARAGWTAAGTVIDRDRPHTLMRRDLR